MLKPKKIIWESWNAKVQEMLVNKAILEQAEKNFLNNLMEDAGNSPGFTSDKEENSGPVFFPEMHSASPNVVYTPYGPYHTDSFVKPSDRWDCWICHTNFDVSQAIVSILETIDGIEALKIMGRYTFFVGIGRLFSMQEVRRDVENGLCQLTEEEITCGMDEELRNAVESVRERLTENKYWSIFISPDGKIDYIISDTFDQGYIDKLGQFEERKYSDGGFILKSGEMFYDEF